MNNPLAILDDGSVLPFSQPIGNQERIKFLEEAIAEQAKQLAYQGKMIDMLRRDMAQMKAERVGE